MKIGDDPRPVARNFLGMQFCACCMISPHTVAKKKCGKGARGEGEGGGGREGGCALFKGIFGEYSI